MPFDGKLVETPALRRAILIDALRNLPPDHQWNFRFVRREDCGTAGCALGLALTLWENPFDVEDYLGVLKASCESVAKFFGISQPEARAVFFEHRAYPGCYWMDNVQPGMVADALEALGDA